MSYFFTKSYVWPLVRIVSKRRFLQVVQNEIRILELNIGILSGALEIFSCNELRDYFQYIPLFNPLARQINCHLLNFLSASIFKVLQCLSNLVKMLSECQTAWIRMRRRVTRRLIRIQAVCIWNYILGLAA